MRFNYNAWYGGATHDLIRTSVLQIEDGHLERVLKVWRGLDEQYHPTYENRANYNVLVEEATKRMTDDVPAEASLHSKPGVVVGTNGILLYEITSEQVEAIAKENDLGDSIKWPILNATGEPNREIPAQIREKARKHPEWQISQSGIGNFRILSTTTDSIRTVYLYRPEGRVLVVLFEEVDK